MIVVPDEEFFVLDVENFGGATHGFTALLEDTVKGDKGSGATGFEFFDDGFGGGEEPAECGECAVVGNGECEREENQKEKEDTDFGFGTGFGSEADIAGNDIASGVGPEELDASGIEHVED